MGPQGEVVSLSHANLRFGATRGYSTAGASYSWTGHRRGTTSSSIAIRDKHDFRSFTRKNLRGGAFAQRKFSVNSVRSPRKLWGTGGQICSWRRAMDGPWMGQIWSFDGATGPTTPERSRGGGRGGGPGHAFERRRRATEMQGRVSRHVNMLSGAIK